MKMLSHGGDRQIVGLEVYSLRKVLGLSETAGPWVAPAQWKPEPKIDEKEIPVWKWNPLEGDEKLGRTKNDLCINK